MKLDRRTFLKVSLGTAGQLALTMCPTRALADGPPSNAGSDVVFPYVEIYPNNAVVIGNPAPEIGQATSISLPMLVAEELDVRWEDVTVRQLPLFARAGSFDWFDYEYRYGPQEAGGSKAVAQHWLRLRRVGATAKLLLRKAAATRWGAPLDEIDARAGRLSWHSRGWSLTYGEVAADAAALPYEPEEIALKARDDFELIGTAPADPNGVAIVTGRAPFGIDLCHEAAVVAVVERAPRIGASVHRHNGDTLRDLDGVIDVVTLRRDPALPHTGTIHSDGVAVVANDLQHAMAARDRLEVEWQGGHTDSSGALTAAAQAAMDGRSGVRLRDDGNVDDAWRRSSHRVEATYRTQLQAHVQMEPQSCFADWRPGRCRIVGPLQEPLWTLDAVAALTGLPPEKISIQPTRMGGGFGRRLFSDHALEALMISQRTGHPVQVFWSREDDMTHDYYRPFGIHRLRATFEESGRLGSFGYTLAGSSAAKGFFDFPDSYAHISEMFPDAVPAQTVPDCRIEYVDVPTNIPQGFIRAPGHTTAAFAVESFIDELAARRGLDPLAFRLDLLGDDRILDYESEGLQFDTGRMKRVLTAAASLGRWHEPAPPGMARGIASHFTYGTYLAHVVSVAIDTERELIYVDAVATAIDCGIAVNPDGVRAQVEGGIHDALSAALGQEITVENGQVQQRNFDRYRMLRMATAPRAIDVEILSGADDPTGVGEPPVPPLAPALANALFALTGQRFRQLPLGMDALKTPRQTA